MNAGRSTGTGTELLVAVPFPSCSFGVEAPGQDAAIGGHRHAVEIAARDAGDAGARGQAHEDRHGTVGGAAVPQLPLVVDAPGQRAAAGGHGQAVVVAGRDRGDPGARGQVHLDGHGAESWWCRFPARLAVAPQANTRPSAVSARLWSAPPATAAARRPRAGRPGPGVDWSMVVSLPICPRFAARRVRGPRKSGQAVEGAGRDCGDAGAGGQVHGGGHGTESVLPTPSSPYGCHPARTRPGGLSARW